jgi:hypothetical protein
MSLHIVRAPSVRPLWETCVERFLDELGDAKGPGGYPSYLWLTHRVQRDALYEAAARRGTPGWLGPPVAFFSDLPRLFGIERRRPIGLLRRRGLVARLAADLEGGLRPGGAPRVVGERRGIAAALDGLFGELLPEGVSPETLRGALADLPGDDFARRRNEWVVSAYEAYLRELEARDRYDPRQIHAIVAERIAEGRLPDALNGARRLHIYGLHTLRTRRRLIEALRDQEEVEVVLYLLREDEPGEWDELCSSAGVHVEDLDGDRAPAPAVKPAPDGRRELEFVASRVKALVASGEAEPHEIAVVARTGREDARRAHEILSAAGVPNTARVRTALAEVPALKAILSLFRGAARGWTYRPLRDVLASHYFELDIDLRSIDFIAGDRRVEGLERWAGQLRRLRRDVEAREAEEEGWKNRRAGLFLDRIERDIESFDEFRRAVEPLERARPLVEWIELTRALLDPGWFGFRRNLCEPPRARRDADLGWEVVRLDQRGVERLNDMLGEWLADEAGWGGGRAVPIEPAEWHARFRRLLESNELALTTPLRTGVQVLEAHEAALFPFKRTFVVHANDGEFPRRAPAWVIFSDEERRTLAERGLPLTHRSLWLRRERTLWRAVTANAGVMVTYRTADPNGVPLLPSLMVPAHDPSTEIPRTRLAWDPPFSPAQARRAAAARLAEMKRNGGPGAIVVAEPEALRHAVLAAYAECQRREGPPGSGRPAGALNPWNGELRDPWLLERLGERFGPNRVWSASQLETYTQCPFIFLVGRVLGLEAFEEAEESTSALTFGGAAHELLERFYRALTEGAAFPNAFDEAAQELFEGIAGEVFAELEGGGDAWLGIPALWAVTKQKLLEEVARYLAWEIPRFKGARPRHFEYAFGDDEADAVTIEGLDVRGVRRRLLLRGRVDRVDERGSGEDAVYEIVDYKSKSKPTGGWYADGAALQIPLYMAALAQRLSRPVSEGCYRSIRDLGSGGRARWGTADFERALRIALSVPERVRAGKFEPRATKSSGWQWYWPGLDVCRVKALVDEGCRFDEPEDAGEGGGADESSERG